VKNAATIHSEEEVPLTGSSRGGKQVSSLSLETPEIVVSRNGGAGGDLTTDSSVASSSADDGNNSGSGGGGGGAPAISAEGRFRDEKYNRKVQHWKDHPLAVGLVEISWSDEMQKFRDRDARRRAADDSSAESANCLCCSAVVCPYLGATRIGNMSVLKQSTIEINIEEEDEETGEIRVVRVARPKLDFVVGPYWPMLFFVTYPLIFGVSGWALVVAIPGKPISLVLAWSICTFGLIFSLAMTGFRDPGIMLRRHNPPPRAQGTWRWSDQAQTFRPRGAMYDSDTGVVVEGFDHTCPW